MIETIIFCVFLVPAMLGMAEMLHLLKVYIISPEKKMKKYLIVFLKDENSVRQLLCLLEEYNWIGKKYAERIIAVNMGLKEEDYKKALNTANKGNMILCEYNEIESILKELS